MFVIQQDPHAMVKSKIQDNEPTPPRVQNLFWKILGVFGGILLFLFSINLLGTAFTHVGQAAADALLKATNNPFISLFIGLLITAIIQSSSTTTSMIVAVVATGSLSLSNAIPMVMGANIGTTLTSTLVSLGFLNQNKAFNRAIAAGSLHDFFNILVTCILFPLEYFYGFLTKLSTDFTDIITSSSLVNWFPQWPFELFTFQPISNFLVSTVPVAWILILVSFILLYLSINLLSKVIYQLLLGDSDNKFDTYIFNKPYKSFGWGLLITASIQSSSVTTSLTVPLVARGSISVKKVLPFILGANLGTTITALIAALFKSEAAISLALAHLLFNFIGVIIFLPIPWLRNVPVYLSLLLGRFTMKYKMIGFLYIILTFFLIPFLLIYFSQ